MVVAIVAIARLLAVAAADPVSDWFAVTPLVSMFYLPTGVVVISMLVFGYWAAVGVALSGFIWTILHDRLGLADSLLLAAAQWTACVLTLGVFTVVCQKWFDHECRALTIKSVLIFVALLSVANAAVHHLTFFVEGELFFPKLETFFGMMIGDALGALVVLLLCNLATSAWIWARRTSV